MPFPYTVGDKLRAPQLRDAIPLVRVLRADRTIASLDVPIQAPGLEVTMDALSTYGIEGYIAYSTGSAPDVAIQLTAPASASGHWAANCLPMALSGSTGDLTFGYTTDFNGGAGGSGEFACGGSGSTGLAVMLSGVITTIAAGQLGFGFGQIVSTASQTTIKAGSYLRLTKIS